MSEASQSNLNIGAKILMGFLLFTALMQVVLYYEVAVLMIKPALFSEDFIITMKETSLMNALICGLAAIPAFVFYLLKKPVVSIIIVLLAMGYLQSRYSVTKMYDLPKTIIFRH